VELFSGTLPDFTLEATTSQISTILSRAYSEYYGHEPPVGEVQAWNNSLVRLKDVLGESVDTDTGVILEYQLPASSLRLDAMILGRDVSGRPGSQIVELKQWVKCSPTDEDNLVVTFVAGKNRPVLHPSAQVARYEEYLKDSNSAFYGSDPVLLGSCAYLHNYHVLPSDPLTAKKFEDVIRGHPLFTADDFSRIAAWFRSSVGSGDGASLLARVQGAKLAPSKQLLRHVAAVLKGVPAYTLLDEQVVVYESVLVAARRAVRERTKGCIIVQGGPGTGKSVIALNLMADLSRSGVNARYATGSRAFTTTLRRIAGSRGESRFDYTLNYADKAENSIDAIIVDEAHRIRKTSALRFTRRADRSGLPQVEEILRAGRLIAFFIDDLQAVRPGEVGSKAYIADNARRLGIPITEFQLEVQFRCQGSDVFVSWLESLLGLSGSAPRVYHRDPEFDFRVLDSPNQLDDELRRRISEGWTARMTAGFCWSWSDPLPDGTLSPDVQIGDFSRAWNAKPDVGRLAKGIPRAPLWAYDPNGVNQIGCIYTAQGFEFDYVGVIVGPDLAWDTRLGHLVGVPGQSEDPALSASDPSAEELIRRAYRVLFSRGIKGCYVVCVEPSVRQQFEARLADR
jgi:uncharacterized protein